MDNSILSFINQPSFQAQLLNLKIFFIAFALVLLVSIIIILLRTNWLRYLILENVFEFFTYRPYGVKKLLKQWSKIRGKLETGLESEYKLAVIETDSVLDEILKKMGYGGESMGERLKQVNTAVVPSIDELWEAHKIRNNIVHDPDYRLNLDEAKKAISIYEKALTDLGAL